MKIYAPVKTANGVYASVRFVDGVGETDNPHLINWFKSHGYTVEDSEKCEKLTENSLEKCEEVVEEIEEPEMMGYAEKPTEPVEKDLEDMTPNELREWAKANGKGLLIKNIRNKEKLLELLRG